MQDLGVRQDSLKKLNRKLTKDEDFFNNYGKSEMK